MGDGTSAFFGRLALLKAHQPSDVHGLGLTRAATGLMSRAPLPPAPGFRFAAFVRQHRAGAGGPWGAQHTPALFLDVESHARAPSWLAV